jgi:HD superfamily phosphodiesterase
VPSGPCGTLAGMTKTEIDTAAAAHWASRAPEVDEDWFWRWSSLHGVCHTQRVHIHAQRLTEELEWPAEDRELVLCAALWHDIGRLGDGIEPGHGASSVQRADMLGLTSALPDADAAIARFAILRHSLSDAGAREHAEGLAEAADPALRLTDPERALRVLWLLKDADALDRVRLRFGEMADPRQLRNPPSIQLIGFAKALFDALD